MLMGFGRRKNIISKAQRLTALPGRHAFFWALHRKFRILARCLGRRDASHCAEHAASDKDDGGGECKPRLLLSREHDIHFRTVWLKFFIGVVVC